MLDAEIRDVARVGEALDALIVGRREVAIEVAQAGRKS
jgi:hypothetical protein